MNDDGFDIIQVFKISWKKKYVLLTIIVISLVLGGIYTLFLTGQEYQSSTKILIDKSDASITEFVHSNDIMSEVARSLNLQASYINKNVTVTFDKTTKIIAISAISKDNHEAYNIVNKYQEILKTKLEETYDVKTYKTIEQPQIANNAYNVNHIKDLLIFLVLGVIVCGIYCIFLVTFSAENICTLIENNGITVLGKIDKENKSNSKVKSYISRNERIISQIKKIMTNIELNKKILRPKSILVTGTNYNTGTTYVTSNLAMRYSRSDKKVLIIDSNFKNGIENRIFNINSEVGLTDLIVSENISLENITETIKQSPISNIYVLSCGSIDIDEELLISEKIAKIIDLVKNQFDIIIIDGEPILKQITSYGWANIVNAVVIVAEYSKTKIEEVLKAKKIIEDIDGKISGVIVNKAE